MYALTFEESINPLCRNLWYSPLRNELFCHRRSDSKASRRTLRHGRGLCPKRDNGSCFGTIREPKRQRQNVCRGSRFALPRFGSPRSIGRRISIAPQEGVHHHGETRNVLERSLFVGHRVEVFALHRV